MQIAIKILVGIVGVAGVLWFFELEEIMTTFWMMVCIPLIFLVSVGLITEATFEAVSGFLPGVFEDLNAKIHSHLDSLRAGDGVALASDEASS